MQLEPTSLASSFFACSEEGSLLRLGFDRAIQELVDFEQLIEDATLDEKEALQVVEEIHARFACFFDAFERYSGETLAYFMDAFFNRHVSVLLFFQTN
jgi:hypothetical protein